MDDKSIRQDIIDELEFEPSVDAAHIGVAVEKGIATLTGHVQTYGQKLLVEDTVRRIKGVRGVVPHVEVNFFGQTTNSDEDIAARAANMIKWNTFVPNDTIQVRVLNGWVTLTGKLEWQFQRQEAEDVVRKLGGVKGVTNQIELTPRASAGDVKQRIENALKRAAAVEAAGITVDVQSGGRVRLEGKVHDYSERYAAERAAWSAPGVTSVDDRLVFA